MKKKIVIAGGSGFLGQILVNHFKKMSYNIVILTRGNTKVKNDIKFVNWDAKNIGDWKNELENAEVLINLTGKSVDCRYTEANKREIISSRVNASKVLNKAVLSLENPPEIWFNASTATIYEFSLTTPMSEEKGIIGNDFSMSVAKAWEKAFYETKTPKTRKIALRISLVLGKSGGVIPVLKNLVSKYLGGHQGNGKQKFAWIHQDDFINIVDFCIKNESLKGPINCVSTSDINNKEFMKAFRKAMNISIGIPSPTFLIHFGAFFMRTEPELILKSRYVVPQILLENGFQFQYKDVNKALDNILNA